MNNPETLTTLGTHDIGRKQTKTKINTTHKTKTMSNTDPPKHECEQHGPLLNTSVNTNVCLVLSEGASLKANKMRTVNITLNVYVDLQSNPFIERRRHGVS
jgi:hypothetical protein